MTQPKHLLLFSFLLASCESDKTPGVTDTDTDVDLQETDETDDGTTETDMEAAPRGAANPPALGQQIDRIGRAAINTALNHTFDGRESASRASAEDAYNAAAIADWGDFSDDFAVNLGILDSLDTVCGNQLLAGDGADRYASLTQVLIDDRLYVNTASGTCGVYLGLEGELVGALEPGEGGCGGRTPTDDVIERSYSVLAAGILAGIDDTIASDVDDAQTATFPYLAPPTE